MTTTSSTGATFVQTVEMLAAYLTDHQLREPALLGVTVMWGVPAGPGAAALPHLAEVAAELLSWTQTLSPLTLQAWRIPAGERVQLSVVSTLTGPAGEMELDVYGEGAHDPILIDDLAPSEKRTVSLGELRAWTAKTPATTGRDGAA